MYKEYKQALRIKILSIGIVWSSLTRTDRPDFQEEHDQLSRLASKTDWLEGALSFTTMTISKLELSKE